MNLINSSYEILTQLDNNILKRIELYGRVCYKSEDKITEDSSKKFCKKLIDSGHESVLEHENIQVRIICSRGISHEIVRHRIASFSMESTRYVDYTKNFELTFIVPNWVKKDNINFNSDQWYYTSELTEATSTWIYELDRIEETYYNLRKLGKTSQEARGILPNDLKTEIIVTTNIREWRHILKLRISKAAHPDMREIMIPLLNEFKEKLPILFDDIKLE